MDADHRLAAIAAAVADGRTVDWAAAESGTASDDERESVRSLQRVQQLAQLHRSFAHQPEALAHVMSGGRLLPFANAAVAGTSGPSTWGRLQLLEQVGEGVFGEVFRARDSALDRDVALKLLRAQEPEGVASAVVHEGRLIARVRHPNVVTVYGAERLDGRVGLWMEFVHGQTLEALLRERGPFGPSEASAIGRDLARALAAVHAAGLVHRDVKAQNVMREHGGRIVLMDFGTGREAAGTGSGEAAGLAGTPLYLAPELLEGRLASVQSDIYSLGVLLYHLVTGGYPLPARTFVEAQQALAAGTRTRLRDARPDLPTHFVEVVDRALAPRPGDRFASAGDVESALHEAERLDAGSEAPQPDRSAAEAALARDAPRGTPRASWTRTPVLGLVGTLAVVAAAAVWWAWPGDGPVLPFAARDWVLVAAFENRTGEKVLDGTLDFALQQELSNSRHVNVVPPERVADTLKLMKRPPTAVLQAGLAREVCLRDGDILALVTGRVDKLGAAYALSVQLIDPDDGRVAASVVVHADGQAQLMPAIRHVSDRVRALLGEHRESISADRRRLEPVTTPSLEALQLYTQAVQARKPSDWRASAELAAAAIAKDPNFASAEVWLAWALANLERQRQRNPWSNRLGDALTHFQRARDLADTVSPRERLFILGSYYHRGAPDLDKAIANYEALLRLYPDDYWATNNLWLAYANTGRAPSETFPLQLRLTELRPNAFGPYMGAVEGGLAAAADREIIRRLVEKGLSLAPTDPAADPSPRQTAYLRTFAAFERWAAGDGRAAGAELDRLRAELPPAGPARHAMQQHLAQQYLALGRIREAEQFYRSPDGLPADWNPSPTMYRAAIGLARGDTRAFRRHVRQMYDDSGRTLAGDRGDGHRMWFLVRAGMIREASQVAELARAEQPLDVALVLGEVAAAQGRDAEAVAEIRTDFSRSPAFNTGIFGWWWRSHETVADALVRAGDLAGAISDLEAVVPLAKNANPQTGSHGYWCLRVRLKLADLYRQAGRLGEAETIERDMLRLLVQADPDFEIAARLRARHPGADIPR